MALAHTRTHENEDEHKHETHDKGIGKVLSNIHVTKHITQFIFGRASWWMDGGWGIGDVAFFSLSLALSLSLSHYFKVKPILFNAMMIWCRVLFSLTLVGWLVDGISSICVCV